ncbi:hypothetical protein [Curtobacterium sp. MCPF17_052]|uniref:WD40/YVTN/BNR-like repeat-containing protein n=1 Tax=Curtobacterium sp. MCPF17_052 TaxID=2175655 RepID=UPI0024DFDA9B|nr:hypothetical protein [Curtobacterium sp. MCPF17_052]WIB11808.1 hypothetical protein DEJ36_13080 [Curtobacterium sp. MCPF17_052]
MIVVLVVIDIALVTLALGRTAPNSGDPAGPIPTFSSSPRSSASSSPSPTADAAGARRSLAAVDGREAWRATDGTCGGPAPTLEHTLDAGATWEPVTLGSDVSSVMAIRASSANLTVLAGVGDDCTPTVRSSTDDGATWSAAGDGAAGAGVSTAGVVLSTGVVDPPCSDPVEAFQGGADFRRHLRRSARVAFRHRRLGGRAARRRPLDGRRRQRLLARSHRHRHV